jgi:predicted ABC-type ATPase
VEARRRGVFRALYEHVERLAEADPEVIGLRLYVEEANKAAQQTYFRLGMARTGYFVLEKYPLRKDAETAQPAESTRSGPRVIVLAGCNGAGKTTASRNVLADELRVMTFVNADVIAQGLAGFDPDDAAIEAGRIMLARLHELADARANFAFETTLAGRAYATWLKQLRQQGYGIHLAYFWLASADLAVARVAERVQLGGHAIPEATIRKRYLRSVRNFFALYQPVVTTWKVYNNSTSKNYEVIAEGNDTGMQKVLCPEIWESMRRI